MSGRKTENVTVPAEWGGRDKGKVFRITEVPAIQAEKWGWRFIIALKGTSAQIPESIAPLGMIAVYIRGVNSFLAADVDWTKLEPLLDELLQCVEMVRDPHARDAKTGEMIASKMVSPDDIEEVRTVAWLRSEVLRVHANFSFIDAVLNWLATANSTISTSTSPTM